MKKKQKNINGAEDMGEEDKEEFEGVEAKGNYGDRDDSDEEDSNVESMDDEGDDEKDDDGDSDEDDYFSNMEAASYWSSWSEENVHVIGLVDNEVVKRTRALKRLKMFLKARSADEENAFEEKDLLKIWKGLHYCMWHSDKLLVQQELAGTLADLISCFETNSSAILFIKCFYLTIVREWEGIDAHRLNKFLTLIRRVWRSSLLFLKKHQWDAQLVSDILQILRETMIKPNASSADGLTFHMIDIYVDELTKVGGFVKGETRPSALTQDGVFDFLRPYVVFSLKEKNRRLLGAVMRDVFDALVGQVEDDYMENLDDEGFEMHGKIDNQKLEGPLDKGAGIDDSPGTRLAVDFSRVGAYILKLGGGKKVAAYNRKILYKVAATFENLSKGIYPWEEFEVEENEGKKRDGGMKKEEIAKAVKRMEKENQRLDLENDGKKRKKRRKRTMTTEEEEEAEEGDDDDGIPIVNDDDDDVPSAPPPTKKQKSKLKHKSSKTETESAKSGAQEPVQVEKKAAKKEGKKPKGSKVTKNGRGQKGALKVGSQSGSWDVKAS